MPSTTPTSDRRAGARALTPRLVIVAGAGIGGLTAALALARSGFRVLVLEQAERLEETGAGIQLSPNAARILIDLGLKDRLRPHAVAPLALRVRDAFSGRDIVTMPLGDFAEQRYGAPYWVIHRGDLQAALAAGVANSVDITVKLATRVEDFIADANRVTVSTRGPAGLIDQHGLALLGADGLWSVVRQRLGHEQPPHFAGRTAWRGLVAAKYVAPELREAVVHLWLGRDAHLVHYPVKGGRVVNIVVIAADSWSAPGWSEPASRAELVPRFVAARWAPQARMLVNLPEAWLKWALYDRPPLRQWSHKAVTLLGDAAHPMLPFLAQGAAMAIEDAAVAAQCLARQPDNPEAAWETYAALRRGRTRKVQSLAGRNGTRFHLAGFRRRLRDTVLQIAGGERLLAHYDWLYDWRPPPAFSIG